jgi:sugar phosphate isomerase/epimerase
MPLIGSKIDETRVDGDLNALRMDLEAYRDLGLDAVELPVHGLDAVKNGRLDERRTREVIAILDQYAFAYSVHAPNPLNLMDTDAQELHVSVFRATLEFAARVNARIVVYHAGRYIPEECFAVSVDRRMTWQEKERALELERAGLSRLSEDFSQIILCVENARPYLHHSPYCYGERPELLRRQIERIDRPNVRINLDLGHLFMSANFYRFDPAAAARDLAPWIAHAHVHDNFGGAVHHHEKQQTHQIPFGRGDAHMPVGWGAIPLKEILGAFLPGYEGMLMMELRGRYFRDTDESRGNLVGLLSELRKDCGAARVAPLRRVS